MVRVRVRVGARVGVRVKVRVSSSCTVPTSASSRLPPVQPGMECAPVARLMVVYGRPLPVAKA